MASDVEICNRALDAIGSETIISLGDSTKRAGLCARYYPQLRDELLQVHPWNFAMARASLAALSDAPVWGYAFQYQIPSDSLRVIMVDGSEPCGDAWRVEGDRILTNATAPLLITYTKRVVASGLFTPAFVSALAARLATELAMPLANDAALRQQMEREFLNRMRAARSADGQEGTPESFEAEEFILARI